MPENDTIHVVYDSAHNILITLGEAGIALSRAEAEQLFLDLGYVLKDLDYVTNEKETD